MFGLQSSSNLLAAPTVIGMVLYVRKHLKTAHLIIPDSFCFKNVSKKSNLEDAQYLICYKSSIWDFLGETDFPLACLNSKGLQLVQNSYLV